MRFQDATTLHTPKLVSPFSFQTSVDINNALPKVVALTENDHSKINADDMQKQTHAETKVPSIKVHQVSIGMTEGEAL